MKGRSSKTPGGNHFGRTAMATHKFNLPQLSMRGGWRL